MSKKSRKKEREEAARREVARREAERRGRSPLEFDSYLEMLEFVAERIESVGHESKKMTHTLEWARNARRDAGELLAFLESQSIHDDWSLVVEADPYELFGARNGRKAWMPIDEDTLEELLDEVDEYVDAHGCDNTRAFTKRWLSKHRLPVGATCMALLAQGGGCDCEVVLNVEPESIFG